jgi:poly(ADP-ribose) glycohydrolase ARH3
MSLSDEQLRDRFAGAILGTMVGDAIGAPIEGWDAPRLNAALEALPELPRAERELQISVFGLITGADVPPGSAYYTDDTQMTFGVAESLIAYPEFDPADMAQRFVANFQPQRGYGPGAYGVLSALKAGAAWDEPAQNLFGGQGSFGNGAAMRAAPIGLLYCDNLPRLRRVADVSSTITHTHVLGRQGAVIQASAVALALCFDGEENDFAPLTFLEEVKTVVGPLEAWYDDGLEDVRTLLFYPPDLLTAAETLVCNIEAHLSVPAALYAFLAHWDSFPEAVQFAVRLGGDTDTIGAMCGAIAGAFHGASAIPPNWLDALENGAKGRDYARQLADELFTVYQTMRDKGADFTRQSAP